MTGQDLGGLTLTSGVYKFDSEAKLTGKLILDAEGNPDAAFIFQIGSKLTTESESSVELINEAKYCRVFWQVGSSATLGTNSDFIGHVFALTSITANTEATIEGQLLACNGSVTLNSNKITNGICAAPTTPTTTQEETTTTQEGTTTTQEGTTTTQESTTTTQEGTTPTQEVTTPTSTTAIALITKTVPTTTPTLQPTQTSDLPKTGENRSIPYIVGGLLILTAIILLSIRILRIRKEKNQS